jgi:hypothetical protein
LVDEPHRAGFLGRCHSDPNGCDPSFVCHGNSMRPPAGAEVMPALNGGRGGTPEANEMFLLADRRDRKDLCLGAEFRPGSNKVQARSAAVLDAEGTHRF